MKIIQEITVSDGLDRSSEEVHSCFPVLSQLQDNTLVLVNRLGATKESAHGKLRIRMSKDSGRTWKHCGKDWQENIQGLAAEFRMGGVGQCANGDLLFSFCCLDRTDPSLPMFNPKTEGLLPTYSFTARSRSGLDTFENPMLLPVAPLTQAMITGPVLLLKDGTLFQGLETSKTYEDANPWLPQSCAIFSKDNGKSWSLPSVIAEDVQGRFYFWDQKTTQIADGRLVAFFWTYDCEKKREAPIHKAWSEDGGATWSIPQSTGIEGQIASPIPLNDGGFALVWVCRHDPPCIRLAVSKDGESWGTEFIIYDHHAQNIKGGDGKSAMGDYLQTMQLWNFGIPSGVQLPNGHLLISFYAPEKYGTCIKVVEVAL